MYFANINRAGPVKYRDVPGSVGVLEAPDKPMPIGQADCKTWDEHGRAVWSLTIGGQPIAGRWVIIDREFKPAEFASQRFTAYGSTDDGQLRRGGWQGRLRRSSSFLREAAFHF